jgi:predicted CXXCH cytochrome family protein
MRKRNSSAAVIGLVISLIVTVMFIQACGTVPSSTQKSETKSGRKGAGKTCLECHPEWEEKMKTGYVHAPILDDRCDACHRPHGIIAGVFDRLPQPDLCLQCHGDKKIAAQQKSVHEPVVSGQCTSCHSPHNSRYEMLLKESRAEICFTCHKQELVTGSVRHPALDKGCQTCHDVHKSDHDFLLVQEADDLCGSCHQVDSDRFGKAHFSFPATTGCILCHTPHSGERAALLKKNVHAPTMNGNCGSCHSGTERGDLKMEEDGLCLTCHELQAEGRTSTHLPYVEKKCGACHAAHASDYSFLLSLPPEESCLVCHQGGSVPPDEKPSQSPHGELTGDEQHQTNARGAQTPSTGKNMFLHTPVRDGNCIACHSGHGADHNHLLTTGSERICFTCHEAEKFGAEGGSHPPDQGRECATCHTAHSADNSILLRQNMDTLCFSCHRGAAEQRGMFSTHNPFALGNCGGCHQMHEPAGAGYITSAAKGDLCLSCHEAKLQSEGTAFTHEPVARGQCQHCHDVHGADFAPVMKKRPGDLCLECHSGTGQEIRNMASPHQPAVQGECVGCHSAHGSPRENMLKRAQPMLCLECHKEVAQFWRDGVAHQPAMENCLHCHGSHGADETGMLKKGKSTLCADCHETGTGEFMEAHGGIKAGGDLCITCHDPHGSPEKGLLFPVGHDPFLKGTCSPCHPGRS